ncbi:MAG TPA: glycosyltransferase family 4 protein [Syntrophales bacterium]|jgi:glycosyltransferase involved in cell wall biosynthesis|nr:glycosyltransferase family 4 protein [Syntrophales bacterium]HOX93957.1 glycosyltransferase family 4 protein [Syntrophales bacterium]HPI57398.1 glycosyltransferase family 4 protein [Syntrophales bacterium]HPN25462.1 glycosyltransferase family 4 protein [Syntrophales bacterium]HQM29944.1 glycosyltransferase family 4 protein [Syntrophales bacterium]
MRILQISSLYPSYDGSRSVNFVHRQIVELKKKGIDIQVICPVNKFTRISDFLKLKKICRKPLRKSIDDINVTYLPYWNFSTRYTPALEILSLSSVLHKCFLAKNNLHAYDLIHAHQLFPVGCACSMTAKKFNVPVVVSARGADVHTYPRMHAKIMDFTQSVIRETDKITAVSRSLAEQIYDLAAPRSTIDVVYNGIDFAKFRPMANQSDLRVKLGLPATGVGLCMISRLMKTKGIYELLNAFKAVASADDTVWLAVVGEGPLRSMMIDWLNHHQLQTRVILAGFRSHDEIPYWINASDIFVFPSYNEGLPNVILEAMACGRPIIATEVGGIPEVVTHGTNAILIPPRTVDPIINAMQKLVFSPQLRQSMGLNGLHHIRSNFSWEKSADSLIGVYREAISARNPYS